jgi:GTP-binding protein HflX
LSQREDVNAVLAELGINTEAEPERLIEVWNKADLLDADGLKRATKEAKRAGAVLVSATTGYGLKALLAEIERRLNRARDMIEIAVKPEEGSLSNWIYENCEVVARSDLGEGITSLLIRVAPEKRERLARLAGPSRLKAAS